MDGAARRAPRLLRGSGPLYNGGPVVRLPHHRSSCARGRCPAGPDPPPRIDEHVAGLRRDSVRPARCRRPPVDEYRRHEERPRGPSSLLVLQEARGGAGDVPGRAAHAVHRGGASRPLRRQDGLQPPRARGALHPDLARAERLRVRHGLRPRSPPRAGPPTRPSNRNRERAQRVLVRSHVREHAPVPRVGREHGRPLRQHPVLARELRRGERGPRVQEGRRSRGPGAAREAGRVLALPGWSPRRTPRRVRSSRVEALRAHDSRVDRPGKRFPLHTVHRGGAGALPLSASPSPWGPGGGSHRGGSGWRLPSSQRARGGRPRLDPEADPRGGASAGSGSSG